MSLGRKVTPWTNPFQIPSRSLSGQRIGIPTLDGAGLTQTTTTDTSNGAVVYSTAHLISGGKVVLLVPIQVHLKHSANSASARVTLELYNGPTTADTPAFTVWGCQVNLSPTNGEWALISQVAVVFFTSPNWTPGTRLFQVRCTPDTAGTLTIGNSDSTAFDTVSIFQMGAVEI